MVTSWQRGWDTITRSERVRPERTAAEQSMIDGLHQQFDDSQQIGVDVSTGRQLVPP
jgi:hypothetical protein